MFVRFICEVGWNLSVLILIATLYPHWMYVPQYTIYWKCNQLVAINTGYCWQFLLTGMAAVFSSWNWSWLLKTVTLYKARIHLHTDFCVCECVCVCSVSQSCLALCSPMGSSPPVPSVHGIFQARTLERVTISFSRGSSQPRYRSGISWVSSTAR